MEEKLERLHHFDVEVYLTGCISKFFVILIDCSEINCPKYSACKLKKTGKAIKAICVK
jgi:hypothetical protein